MSYYHTEEMPTFQAKKFIKLMSDGIGVDYELNDAASGVENMSYVMVCDLEGAEETELCRKYEKMATEGE